jgi:hypothetical protein
MVRVLCGLLTLFLLPARASAQLDGGIGAGGAGQIFVIESGVVQGAPNLPPVRDNRPPATGRSTIRGRIVAADSGQPLRRTTVRINAPELRGQRATLTDADGRYEFGQLPAGRYSVNASKNVYVGWSYGQTQAGSPGKPIVLGDAQVASDINIALPRGSVITGRVTDELGEPVAGVIVMLMRPQFVQGQQRLAPAGGGTIPPTNDIGEYRLYGMAPGQYYVSVQPQPGFQMGGGPFGNQTEGPEARSGYARTFYPGTPDVSNAQKVTVGLGQTLTEINIVLQPTRLAAISGVAVDAQGQPLGRGNVQMMPRGGMLMGGLSGGPIGPDGTFTVQNVAPGVYTMRATAPRIAPGPGGPPGPPEFSVAVITVNGEDVSGVRLTPVLPVAIHGRVTFDDPGAAASVMPSSIRVLAQPLDPDDSLGFPGGGGPPPTLQADFSFELKTMPGRIALRAILPPAAGTQNGWQVKAIRVNGTDATDTGVDVEARGAGAIEIELTNRRQQISGTVSDGRGNRVKDSTVLLFAQDRGRWTAPFNRYLARTQAGDDGLFQVGALPPGDYYAIALDGADLSAWQDPDFLDGLMRQASTFSLTPGESRTLDLKLFTLQ